jgi:hypothetical protein
VPHTHTGASLHVCCHSSHASPSTTRPFLCHKHCASATRSLLVPTPTRAHIQTTTHTQTPIHSFKSSLICLWALCCPGSPGRHRPATPLSSLRASPVPSLRASPLPSMPSSLVWSLRARLLGLPPTERCLVAGFDAFFSKVELLIGSARTSRSPHASRAFKLTRVARSW